MNSGIRRSGTFFSLVAAGFLAATLCTEAQVAAPAPQQPGPDILRIRRFSGLGARNLVKTPEFRTDAQRGVIPRKDWFQISVNYDTAPEWIDELTFQYLVMSLARVDGELRYSLFSTTVRYADIPAGRGHNSTAFLHPRALERFGDIVAVAVEIMHAGQVIARESNVASDRIPEDWWRNPLVTESPTVTARSGYILDRARSPFALINIDDYQFIK